MDLGNREQSSLTYLHNRELTTSTARWDEIDEVQPKLSEEPSEAELQQAIEYLESEGPYTSTGVVQDLCLL